jgi:NADPH:quinone reductase
MRAAWYEKQGEAAEVLIVGEMPDPEPQAAEVRIRVRSSGVNPGEIKKRQGWLGSAMPYARVVPHSDGAGEIDAVGAGVHRSRLGERVWCFGAQSYRPFGTAAEYVTVPAWQAVRLPARVSFEQGACLGIPGITAHRALFADGPIEGLTVLIAGATGGVGSVATQLAAWGGAVVIGAVRNSRDVERARELGARHVVNMSDEDAVAQVRRTAPGGVHRVVEVAFGPNAAFNSRVVSQGAVIASYGTPDPEPALPYWPLAFQNVVIRLLGSDDFPQEAKRQAAADLVLCLEAAALRIEIREVFSLGRIAEAHRAVERATGSGRVVIKINEDVDFRPPRSTRE